MQNYNPVQTTDTVANGPSVLNANDQTIMSNSSGTAFPTANLLVGMKCFRTDLKIEYTLTATSPVTWTQTLNLNNTNIDSGNVGSYAPSLTGAGASGSWGISITGSAASLVATNSYTVAGLTSTGAIALPGNPSSALQAAPKQYVDSAVAGITVPVTSVFGRTGAVVLGASDVTNALGTTAVQNAGYATSAGSASSASSVAWTGVSGRPTALSSFSNDSGYTNAQGTYQVLTFGSGTYSYNGGGNTLSGIPFIYPNKISGNCFNPSGSNCSQFGIGINKSGNGYNIVAANCNCNCCCCC